MSEKEKAPQFIFFGTLFVISFCVLRIATWLFIHFFHNPRIVIPHVLTLSIVENSGIAFGISIAQWVVVLVAFLLTIGCFVGFGLALLRQQRMIAWGFFFATLGALSNLMDRIQYGAVIDYFSYPSVGSNNVSDFLITIGVSILVIYLFTHTRHARSSHDSINHTTPR